MAIIDRLVVDIGGGNGGRAVKEARHFPKTNFFLIDPLATPPNPNPGNLCIIPKLVCAENPVGLSAGSVDVVYLDFVLGEVIRAEGDPNITDENEAISRYGFLVSEAVRLLRKGGKVSVMEPRENINRARKVFVRHQFETTPPVVVEDQEITSCAKHFFGKFASSGRSPEESHVLPMRFEASKKGNIKE